MSGQVADIQVVRHNPAALAVRLTLEKQKAFLERLEVTGNISEASDAVGISRNAAYELRARDPEFDTAIVETMERVTDRLEAKIRARAEDGTAKGVWYKGERCGEEIEHHDVLAMFMLKAARPDQYRENQGVQVNVGLSVESTAKLSDQELEYVVAQQLRKERAINVDTFNVIKAAHDDSTKIQDSTKQQDNTTQYTTPDVVYGNQGPKTSEGGGGGLTTRRQRGPGHRQRRAKISKSRKRTQK